MPVRVGICASAWSRTAMWLAAVLLPALPGRRVVARNSPVCRRTPAPGDSKVCLNAGAGFSFSEWHTTMCPSMSITSASTPAVSATRDGPNAAPVVLARCAYATSRARAEWRPPRPARGRPERPAAADWWSPRPPPRTGRAGRPGPRCRWFIRDDHAPRRRRGSLHTELRSIGPTRSPTNPVFPGQEALSLISARTRRPALEARVKASGDAQRAAARAHGRGARPRRTLLTRVVSRG